MRSRRLWFGLAVSLVFLLLLFLRVDLKDTVRSLGKANYLFVVPAIALYFVALVFRTLRWRFLLSHLKPIPVDRLLPVVVVGYMANNLLPIRLGEVVRSYYLGQREGVSKSAGLATIAVERVFDGLTLLFFLAVASMALPIGGLVQDLAEDTGLPALLLIAGTTVPFVFALGSLIVVAYRPAWPVWLAERVTRRLIAVAYRSAWLVWLVERVTRRQPEKLGPSIVEVVELFVSGLASLRDPRRLLALFLLSLPVWIMEAAMLYVIGFSFDLQDSFSSQGMMIAAILATTATANLATSLPSSQGGIGPFELFSTATLVVLGVAGPVATAYTVTVHAALLVPVTLLGLAFLWRQNLSLAQLTRVRGEEKDGYTLLQGSATEREPK